MTAATAVAQAARLARVCAARDFEDLQLRELTEAVCARFVRRLGLGRVLGECLIGAEDTGAGLGFTGALATGVGETGVVAGAAVETGLVVAGAVLVAGAFGGGVVLGGVAPNVVVSEPSHSPSAQHGSTTRSLLTAMPGPAMIQRFRGE